MDYTVLLTNYFVQNYTGSEIDVCSIAEAFRNRGADVEIATFKYGNPLYEKYADKGILFTDIKNEKLKIGKYDLIIGHHNPVLIKCLFMSDIEYKRAVFSSLSPYMKLERPPFFINELTLCMANSYETRDMLIKNDVKEELIRVFPNYVPREFMEADTKKGGGLKRICVVSNHVPTEILDAVQLLRKIGLMVDIYGKGHYECLITPEVLNDYDIIITIGKTVQYGMALGIPVYCYDIHGGPGWLNKSNIGLAGSYNYSGRGFEKKSGEIIFRELVEGYVAANQMTGLFRQLAEKEYCLQDNLDALISQIESRPCLNQSEFVNRYMPFYKTYSIVEDMVF